MAVEGYMLSKEQIRTSRYRTWCGLFHIFFTSLSSSSGQSVAECRRVWTLVRSHLSNLPFDGKKLIGLFEKIPERCRLQRYCPSVVSGHWNRQEEECGSEGLSGAGIVDLKMRQQEHQLQNQMDNNDRKRGETTSLDEATHQHKASVKGRINNDPLPLPPSNDLNSKVDIYLIYWLSLFVQISLSFSDVKNSNYHYHKKVWCRQISFSFSYYRQVGQRNLLNFVFLFRCVLVCYP